MFKKLSKINTYNVSKNKEMFNKKNVYILKHIDLNIPFNSVFTWWIL